MSREASSLSGAFRFFDLPAELRTQIYEELLVTDASLRLGHHGPFCLVPRKSTHPAILRSCRRALTEGVPVLYGANSFFLGTIGFKPIYSCSFATCIGPTNAALIRKLVVHASGNILMSRARFKEWIDGLGIAFDTLKVLAISFEGPKTIDRLSGGSVPLGTTGVMNNTIPPLLNLNPPPVLPTQNLGPVSPYLSNVPQNTLGTSPTPSNITTATVTVTTTTTWQSVAQSNNQPFPGVPTWTQVAPTSTNITATATTGASDGPPSIFERPRVRVPLVPREIEIWAARESSWLKHAQVAAVRKVINTANTDLRACGIWLLYCDPNVRRLPRDMSNG